MKSRNYRDASGTLSKPKRLPDGRVVYDAFLTRAGVFSYRNPDGSERRELRHPDDVFDPESMASANLIPFTNNHPDGVVNDSNATDLMKGSTGESARRDGNRIRNTIVVMDGATIAAIDAGKDENSCGYRAESEEKPGVYQGERYDVRQRNIRYNHVALVDEGRAGPDIRVRADQADASIMIVRHDGAEVSPMEEKYEKALVEIVELKVRADKADADKDAAVLRADKAEAERDTAKDELKTRNDAADKASETANAERAASVKLRVDAAPVLDEVADDATDKDVQLALITKVFNQDASEKSDGYIEARAEMAIETAVKNDDALNATRTRTAAGGALVADDADKDPEEAAKARMIARRNKKASA